jgi:hypothetical protein
MQPIFRWFHPKAIFPPPKLKEETLLADSTVSKQQLATASFQVLLRCCMKPMTKAPLSLQLRATDRLDAHALSQVSPA